MKAPPKNFDDKSDDTTESMKVWHQQMEMHHGLGNWDPSFDSRNVSQFDDPSNLPQSGAHLLLLMGAEGTPVIPFESTCADADSAFSLQQKNKVQQVSTRPKRVRLSRSEQLVRAVDAGAVNSEVKDSVGMSAIVAAISMSEEKLRRDRERQKEASRRYRARKKHGLTISNAMVKENVYPERKRAAQKGHADAVHSVAWNTAGTQVASGSSDKTIRVWDVVTDTCVKTLTDMDTNASDLSIRLDQGFPSKLVPVLETFNSASIVPSLTSSLSSNLHSTSLRKFLRDDNMWSCFQRHGLRYFEDLSLISFGELRQLLSSCTKNSFEITSMENSLSPYLCVHNPWRLPPSGIVATDSVLFTEDYPSVSARREELDSLVLPCGPFQTVPAVAGSNDSALWERALPKLFQMFSPATARDNDERAFVNRIDFELERACQALASEQYRRFSRHDDSPASSSSSPSSSIMSPDVSSPTSPPPFSLRRKLTNPSKSLTNSSYTMKLAHNTARADKIASESNTASNENKNAIEVKPESKFPPRQIEADNSKLQQPRPSKMLLDSLFIDQNAVLFNYIAEHIDRTHHTFSGSKNLTWDVNVHEKERLIYFFQVLIEESVKLENNYEIGIFVFMSTLLTRLKDMALTEAGSVIDISLPLVLYSRGMSTCVKSSGESISENVLVVVACRIDWHITIARPDCEKLKLIGKVAKRHRLFKNHADWLRVHDEISNLSLSPLVRSRIHSYDSKFPVREELRSLCAMLCKSIHPFQSSTRAMGLTELSHANNLIEHANSLILRLLEMDWANVDHVLQVWLKNFELPNSLSAFLDKHCPEDKREIINRQLEANKIYSFDDLAKLDTRKFGVVFEQMPSEMRFLFRKEWISRAPSLQTVLLQIMDHAQAIEIDRVLESQSINNRNDLMTLSLDDFDIKNIPPAVRLKLWAECKAMRSPSVIEVTDASYEPRVNGRYFKQGLRDGVPTYCLLGKAQFYRECSARWRLSLLQSSRLCYSNFTADFPPTSNWTTPEMASDSLFVRPEFLRIQPLRSNSPVMLHEIGLKMQRKFKEMVCKLTDQVGLARTCVYIADVKSLKYITRNFPGPIFDLNRATIRPSCFEEFEHVTQKIIKTFRVVEFKNKFTDGETTMGLFFQIELPIPDMALEYGEFWVAEVQIAVPETAETDKVSNAIYEVLRIDSLPEYCPWCRTEFEQ